jgi:hypothetical protein
LVRAQFEEIHRWCEARDLPVQAITGIPYFYRQFGYEMALDLSGRRYGFEPYVPGLKKGEREIYRIRPANDADLRFITKLYAQAQKRYAISCVRRMDMFAWDLHGHSRRSVARFEIRIIEDQRGRSIGYFQYGEIQGMKMNGLVVVGYELTPGTPWLEVTPAVVRYLWRTGEKDMQRKGKTCSAFGFQLGTEHPAYEVMEDALPKIRNPYAWYLRVPDLPGFLQRVAPVLE